MRITSKGQVTIPISIREKAGLVPYSEVDFEFDGDVVRIIPVKGAGRLKRGAQIVAHLRGAGSGAMTTDDIMALTRGEG